MAFHFSMSILQHALVVLPASQPCQSRHKVARMEEWKAAVLKRVWRISAEAYVQKTSSLRACGHFCGRDIGAKVWVLVCVCVWLAGGAQRGLGLITVIHTVGSESYLYSGNGKETTGLGCPCFTVLESWHLACVCGPKLQFPLISTVLCGF